MIQCSSWVVGNMRLGSATLESKFWSLGRECPHLYFRMIYCITYHRVLRGFIRVSLVDLYDPCSAFNGHLRHYPLQLSGHLSMVLASNERGPEEGRDFSPLIYLHVTLFYIHL